MACFIVFGESRFAKIGSSERVRSSYEL